ncbi:thiamine/thiamine pyrophosphate ABC transporter permease [Rhizobium sp. LjRoot254]|uniref:thiamine/thiamine pyrophosphate ABC transporter permease n=1 Tax=Rhizobium sp. LjRoot254 TaxID=3342297 RepID=UPI003ECDDD74
MIEATGERRFWVSAGGVGLTLLAAFCLAAFAMLLASAAASSWPPFAYLARIFVFTIEQAVLSTLLSVLFALPLVLAMARRPDFPGRRFVLALMILPLGLPVLPAVFGLLEIWGRTGLVNDIGAGLGFSSRLSIYGLSGILLAHVFFNLPLAARLMLKALERVPRDEWRLAASVGLPRFSLFRFVEMPALVRVVPGIAGLIFMLCVTSFTIILTLGGGPQNSTLEVAIYQALKFEFDPARAMILSFAQFALTAVIFWLLRLFPDPEEDRRGASGRPFRPDARPVGARMADGVTLGVFLAFVGAPVLAIVVAGLGSNLAGLLAGPKFWQALRTSLTIALSAGLLATILTYAMARAEASLPDGPRSGPIKLLFRFPEFMLLIPPLALGSGWFLILLSFGMADGAGPILVVLINMGMALPFAARIIAPELTTHLKRTARLSASLGISGFARFRVVDWPVMRAPLLTAFSFAAALSFGDLGAVALFGSDNFITLPSLLYASLGSYRSTDAAGLSLILGVICFLLTLPSVRLESSSAGDDA